MMSVKCTVFVDGSLTGALYEFSAVPRQGDNIQIGTTSRDWMLTVDSVVFVAAGLYGHEPDIQIRASKK